MSEWFYVLQGKQLGPVPEADLIEKIRRRELGTATLVWQEGKTEWLRAASVFPDVIQNLPETALCAISGERKLISDMLKYGEKYVSLEHKEEFVQALQSGAPIRPKVSAHRLGYIYRNPQARATAAKVLVIIVTLLGLIELFLLLGVKPWSSESAAEGSTLVVVTAIFRVFHLLAIGVTAFVFCLWIYCVSKNANAFTNASMKFSPCWAVGYFFMPVLGLWRPFSVTKEIFRVSCENEKRGIVARWWILFLLTGTGHLLALSSGIATSTPGFLCKAVAVLLSIPLAVFSLKLIHLITAAQIKTQLSQNR